MDRADTSLELAVLLAFVREPDPHLRYFVPESTLVPSHWKIWDSIVLGHAGPSNHWVLSLQPIGRYEKQLAGGFHKILKCFQSAAFRAKYGLERHD